MKILSDVPPNSLRDPNVSTKVKQHKKKRIGPHSLTCSTFEVRDGTRMNSQARVQNEINLHNQEKKGISAS